VSLSVFPFLFFSAKLILCLHVVVASGCKGVLALHPQNAFLPAKMKKKLAFARFYHYLRSVSSLILSG
jgi:hypothetical protein